MNRIPAPILVAGGFALVVALLYGARALTGDGFVPVVKVCGCLLA
jgi:hypothetical protein